MTRPPLDVSGPTMDKPGLTDRQKQELDRLGGKLKSGKSISDFERGTLAAFATFGHEKDSARAARILAGAKRQKEAQK
jgi:hypothetical protein